MVQLLYVPVRVETVMCDNFTLRAGEGCKKERRRETDDRLFSTVRTVKSNKLEIQSLHEMSLLIVDLFNHALDLEIIP